MENQILENNYLKVTVADMGAELISVFDKESQTERMWDANPKVWNRHAPILFPFVGKVSGGVYRYCGQEYEMKSQHGFARDLEFVCVKRAANSVTHLLRADDETKKSYPFDFELYITHTLDTENGRVLHVQWEIRNIGVDKMYYSIGGHPAFKVPARAGERRADYYLQIPQNSNLKYILLNEKTGLASPEKTSVLELEEGFYPIYENMFDKDALIFEGGQIKEAGIARPDKSPYITMKCEGFPYFGIWSKPEGEFVCLEPWMGRTDNDGFGGTLEEKAGEQMLEAGEIRNIGYTVEFH